MNVRPMRGQAWLAKDPWESGKERRLESGIIVPATAHNPKETHQHVGTVLRLGAPARTAEGVEVPWECKVGDEVLYVYALATEEFRTVKYWDDGEIVIVAQAEVIGVVER